MLFFQRKKDEKKLADNTQETAKNDKKTSIETINFAIEGMHCTSCALNIDGNLEDTPGVTSASTNYAKSLTTVTYDPKKTTLSDLEKAISAAGYTAHPKE